MGDLTAAGRAQAKLSVCTPAAPVQADPSRIVAVVQPNDADYDATATLALVGVSAVATDLV